MTNRAERRRKKNLVETHKSFAEQFLAAGQDRGDLPKTVSAVFSIRVGDFIMNYQFDRNKLVGCVAVNKANVDQYIKQVRFASNQPDVFGNGIVEEPEEDIGDVLNTS